MVTKYMYVRIQMILASLKNGLPPQNKEDFLHLGKIGYLMTLP